MDETHGIGGKPLSPEDVKLYQQEYREGTKLFERALDRYTTSNNPYQKEEYMKVMHRANQVLNDAARALKDKELQENQKEIEKDLTALKDHPAKSVEAKLRNDLKRFDQTNPES